MAGIFEWFALNFDFPILDWIAENLRCAFLDAVMPVITMLGDAGWFWIACAVILLFIPKYRKVGLSMGAALIMGLVVCNITMKPLLARIRPYDLQAQLGQTIDLLISKPHDFAFPSGHTLASFEGATVLAIHNKKLGIPALILASLIAFSRLYLYVHYVTDVLFSLGMGIGFAFLGSFMVHKGFSLYENRKLAK